MRRKKAALQHFPQEEMCTVVAETDRQRESRQLFLSSLIQQLGTRNLEKDAPGSGGGRRTKFQASCQLKVCLDQIGHKCVVNEAILADCSIADLRCASSTLSTIALLCRTNYGDFFCSRHSFFSALSLHCLRLFWSA